ncbi:bifunctional 4-hydroxy-2-oxoglutarate aldolase/2-dehydro-3-deoxy-phosphogluconate aldolase [Chryseobacterium proteolyticum]|uniref:bifunctional 4-hydroxy-2-oxoglutarate aldolase/2-dehydro-3-deoxy-phosphogluconate aldolase n=1 Tax=Chryseobacterium proteolyticum TaxID=118127 RepID=UPI0039838B95
MNTIINTIEAYPIIPVYYHNDPARCIEAFNRSYQAGIRVFEFVNRGEKAEENFKKIVDYRDKYAKEIVLGAGTITSRKQAETFIGLNADFLVSPVVLPEIAEAAAIHHKIWIPGAMTPTEIAICSNLGAKMIKIFPASVIGTSFLKGIKPLFPHLKFMVTGGIPLEIEEIKKMVRGGCFSNRVRRSFIETIRIP